MPRLGIWPQSGGAKVCRPFMSEGGVEADLFNLFCNMKVFFPNL